MVTERTNPQIQASLETSQTRDRQSLKRLSVTAFPARCFSCYPLKTCWIGIPTSGWFLMVVILMTITIQNQALVMLLQRCKDTNKYVSCRASPTVSQLSLRHLICDITKFVIASADQMRVVECLSIWIRNLVLHWKESYSVIVPSQIKTVRL